MTLTSQTLAVAKAYCAASGADLARASQRALGDGRRLVRLDEGDATLTLARADRALQWFSDHWPEGARWPVGVPRPGSAPAPEAEPRP